VKADFTRIDELLGQIMSTCPFINLSKVINIMANYIDAKPEDCLRISSFADLVRVAVRRPIKLNVLRVLAYPLVRLRLSLRQLIVVVGVKRSRPLPKVPATW
jgi:hypothetical protein